ncbi:RHS repeat-associated core domain-containing protein [Streptomyces sp. NPDC001500]
MQPTLVGGLPITLRPQGKRPVAGTALIEVLGRKETRATGLNGVLLTATPAQPGDAQLTINYAAFASAYGGDWAGRLNLSRLPECVLTTPEKAACRTLTPLTMVNDADQQTVTAQVGFVSAAVAAEADGAPAPGKARTVVLALAASGETASAAGTFKATELSPSSSWTAGSSSGSFGWSYPFDTPPVAAGPLPKLELSYDSGSTDGRTANTNTQATVVGEGFNSPGASYIERQYGSCDDDGQADKFDMCWKYDNASLVLDGKSSELVKDDTSGQWRLKDDDASKVEQLRDTSLGNGDSNGEYWRVTTGDGTKYTFGLHKLPGAPDSERTNSVWTVPVFGDDTGEPGYSGGNSFADRWDIQGWRWNLDLVEDTHGNAMTYWYNKETNYYKRGNGSTANAVYTRGGTLQKILFGQSATALFTTKATAQVAFTYDERCLATGTGCDSLTEDSADKWPDVPYDAICASGDSNTDCLAVSPSFFTRKRVTKIATGVWNGTAYTPVDSWTLSHKWEDGQDIGNTSDQTLVLTGIERTGHTGTAIKLDPVSFTYQLRPNRVEGGTTPGGGNILPYSRPRMHTITSETGAITTVTLSPAECVRGSNMPAAEDTNSKSCYPVYWNINGSDEASLDWFHKYRVTAVLTDDPVAGSAIENEYAYSNPGWHYDDSPITPADERTWSIWRGYGQVTTYTGRADRTRSKTTSVYMQGMNGDRLLTSATNDANAVDPDTRRSAAVKAVPVSGLPTADWTDSDQYAGFLRQEITYDGTTPIAVSVNNPWSQRTASQQKSYAHTEAYYVRPGNTATHTYLTVPKTWRTTSTTTSYDSFGMVTKVGTAETCTRTWYARTDDAAAGIYINSLVSRTRTVGKPCSTPETDLSLPTDTTSRGDVLSDAVTVYDNPNATAWSPTQSPTKGEATWSGRPAAYPAASGGERHPSNWQTLAITTFDALGRPLVVSNGTGKGKTSRTTYTPTGHGPVTRVLTYNAMDHRTITYYDGLRGLKLREYDANNRLTESAYDALGRLTDVWLPDRVRGSNDSPSASYGYTVKRGSAPAVSTSLLKSSTVRTVAYQIFDSLYRPLQTQNPTPLGGRLLTDTRYDDRGLVSETYDQIFDDKNTPDPTYTKALHGEAPAQTLSVFDGAGRPTTSTFLILGIQKSSTTTTYTGDSTATTAPEGGQGSRIITDALGRTVERRDYAGPTTNDPDYGGSTPAPAYTKLAYHYTRDGKTDTITGNDGAVWSKTFDLFGRETQSTDPDKGTSTTSYTGLDTIDWTQSNSEPKVYYETDDLGRTTGLWQTSKEPVNKLAEWVYDSKYKGQLDASIRYIDGRAYTDTVVDSDQLYRPTKTQLTLPSDDPLVATGAAANTYTAESSYYLDGTLATSTHPAVGGLPAEKIMYGYNTTGQVSTVSGATSYLLRTSFSALGQAEQLTLGTSEAADTKQTYLTNVFEQGTGRLTHADVTTPATAPYRPQNLDYTYDQAGNVTKIADTPQGSTADVQCFGYDGYRRLTQALTPANGDCADVVTGGAAPYRSAYTYNNAGQRTSETTYNGTTPTTRNYCYNKADKPHRLTATTTAPSCNGVDDVYSYNAAGATTNRPGPTGTRQTLTWNSDGALASLTEDSKKTDYLYDANGELLIRRAVGDGESVLYLGATELHVKATGATARTWATRSYAANGTVVAVRSNEAGTNKLKFVASDHHGTAHLAVDAATQEITRRFTTPFGAERGTATGPAWIDDKSFLGKPADKSTGLIHIGAREYDSIVGQFLSVDPVLAADSPQSLNGYSYANNNPATSSDPTGECADFDCPTRNCASCLNATPGDSDSPALNDYPGSGSTPTNGKKSGGGHSGGSGSVSGGGSGVGAVIPYAAGVKVISTLKLPWPPRPWSMTTAQSVGQYAFMSALTELRDWFGAEPNGRRYRSGLNIVLAQVIVDGGKKGVIPRTIAVLNAGASPKTVAAVKELLSGLNVVVFQATGQKSDGNPAHSEQGVRKLAEDAGLQRQKLGGKIIRWQSAYSTNTICSEECARDLGGATGRDWRNLQDTNGFVDGVLIDDRFKKAMRNLTAKDTPYAHRAIVLAVRGISLLNNLRNPPAAGKGDIAWGILDDEIDKP